MDASRTRSVCHHFTQMLRLLFALSLGLGQHIWDASVSTAYIIHLSARYIKGMKGCELLQEEGAKGGGGTRCTAPV